jgi:hypothetical protein
VLQQESSFQNESHFTCAVVATPAVLQITALTGRTFRSDCCCRSMSMWLAAAQITDAVDAGPSR